MPKDVFDVMYGFVWNDDSGKEIEWTEGQKDIIRCILLRHSPTPEQLRRIHVQTPTRYGKSYAVAAGVLVRASHKKEKWAIVAPTEDKAKIIMDYAIRFALENPTILDQLEIDKSQNQLEGLSRERSKRRLTFKDAGEIRVFSADARNKIAAGNALMGFGSKNVIEDESALIDDDIHSKVMRMLGDAPDNFLMKIGNPFRRNHFLKSYQSARYYRILIDWKQMVKEGRATLDFINEMREELLFDILYEAKFPAEDMVDSQGWMNLITDRLVEDAMIDDAYMIGRKRVGLDIAGGGRNYNAAALRSANYAEKVLKDRRSNTMEVLADLVKLMRLNGLYQDAKMFKEPNAFIDKVGVGKGAYDQATRLIPYVRGVGNGEVPSDKVKYANLRAECYDRLRLWLKAGGRLSKDKDWYQLSKIKYKVNHKDQMVIMPKEVMLKQGVDSPDVADALALTFATPEPLEAHQTSVSPMAIQHPVPNDDPFDKPHRVVKNTPVDDPFHSSNDF